MPNSLPEQKVTEEKKKKWGDPNEDVQFVCMGAKLQCQYCNPPMGDLMPTTEQIMLQDKPWATVGDKQPAANIIFSGLCMHPSQQRPLSSPPPCAGVIQLGDWENYSETIVGSHNALLKKSTIRCNISNQNITIMDSGQRATLEDTNSSDKEKKQEKWILPKPFARSQNLAGQDKDGKIAEDMMYGDKTMIEILQIDPLFYRELEELDTSLFIKMGVLMFLGTGGNGLFNNLGLVTHFQSNTGNVFSSDYMNRALENHPSFKEFVYKDKGIIKVLKQELKKYNGNVNKIAFLQKDEIDWSQHPKFNKAIDRLNGMILAVDNTSGFMVHIDKYELLSTNTFNATLRIDIWDNFGLDKADVEKFITYAGFRAWYVLQHVRGYKPFITKMTCNIDIKNESF